MVENEHRRAGERLSFGEVLLQPGWNGFHAAWWFGGVDYWLAVLHGVSVCDFQPCDESIGRKCASEEFHKCLKEGLGIGAQGSCL